MFIKLEEIHSAKHIVIVTNSENFANASAMYSFLLTLHKKVSLFSSEPLDKRLTFLPWYDKCRTKIQSSADYTLEISFKTKALFSFFQSNAIKINKKMATALYSSILQEYEAFISDKCDSEVFSIASKLLELGADKKLCQEYAFKRNSLASFRLKSRLFENMLLSDDAKVATLYLSDIDLQATGATIDDANLIAKEALNMVNVREVRLVKSDENSKILKTVKDL